MANSQRDNVILMIEDDVTLCELIGSFLQQKGYVFIHHNTYEGAYQKIKEILPDLIILDLHFPDGNGLHLCKRLKLEKALSGIPILILTTRDYPVEKDIAITTGVTGFYHKPMDYRVFAEKIDRILKDTIEIIFWGVRGSIPCPGYAFSHFGGNTMCLQVKIPGKDNVLIFDAGSGIRQLGNTLMSEGRSIIGNLFFTHAHWDHIQGFPFFTPIYYPQNRFDIHMPPQLSGSTRKVLLKQMSYTYFPVTSRMLQSRLEYHTQKQASYHCEGFNIEYIPANHPVETAIYKIRMGKRVIIFCPDNELPTAGTPDNKKNEKFLEQFDDFVTGADILIHDAQYSLKEYEAKKNWGHSAWEVVVERSMKNNIRQLILTHYDPDSSDEKLFSIQKQIEEMNNASEMNIHLSREGKSFFLSA